MTVFFFRYFWARAIPAPTGTWDMLEGTFFTLYCTYLGTDDTVTTEERWGEDVHRTTFTERHTILST